MFLFYMLDCHWRKKKQEKSILLIVCLYLNTTSNIHPLQEWMLRECCWKQGREEGEKNEYSFIIFPVKLLPFLSANVKYADISRVLRQ